jgi:hypothetical protein
MKFTTNHHVTVRNLLRLVVGLAVGCSTPSKVPSIAAYEVEFMVESDSGNVLEEVSIFSGRRLLGTTDALGLAHFRVQGNEGDSRLLELKCPDGYVSNQPPVSARLTHTRPVGIRADKPLRLTAVCNRVSRDVAVVVHAERSGPVPVTVDGQTVVTTTSDGFAEILMHVARDVHSVTLGFDTSAQSQLTPKNPSRTFELPTGDSILVFSQRFVKHRSVVSRSNLSREIRHTPYKVD